MKSFNQFLTEEEVTKAGKKISTGKSTIKLNPNSEELKEDETCSCDDKKKALRMQELKNKINEAINKRTSKDRIIHDFVHSSDSRFKGASKKDRIKRALGAWYGMHKEAAYVYGGSKPEPKDNRKTVTNADKTGNTKAWQNYKAGHKGYKAADHVKEEFEINEAEGSYGQTPKATAAYGALANKRRNTPASEYPKRGAKKVAVQSAERHMSRSENPDAGNRGKQSTKPHWTSGSRKGMTPKDRNWRRGADEYGHSGYDGEGGGGSLPKGKKLTRQRKTGVSEATRYEKETGKDYKTGKEVTKGGTLGGNDTNAKVMRHMHKSMGAGRMGSNGPIQPRGQKKVPGKKPPEAGKYGSGVKSPAQKLAAKRAAIQQGKDNMSSRFD
jgi:hypothetical protein